jgi:hypothetical protein
LGYYAKAKHSSGRFFAIVVIKLKITPAWTVRVLSKAELLLHSHANAFWPRVLAGAIAGLTFCATTIADVPSDRMKPFPQPDHRIARLEKFFKTYHCPMPYHTSDYLRAADGYGLDYRLLPALSIRETLCGKAERQQHNAWGYHPGHQTFPSVEIGIDFVAQRLAEHQLYKGKTLDDKLFTYNPRSAYPGEIRRIMGQIE